MWRQVGTQRPLNYAAVISRCSNKLSFKQVHYRIRKEHQTPFPFLPPDRYTRLHTHTQHTQKYTQTCKAYEVNLLNNQTKPTKLGIHKVTLLSANYTTALQWNVRVWRNTWLQVQTEPPKERKSTHCSQHPSSDKLGNK